VFLVLCLSELLAARAFFLVIFFFFFLFVSHHTNTELPSELLFSLSLSLSLSPFFPVTFEPASSSSSSQSAASEMVTFISVGDETAAQTWS
jgi:hypothetical protein